MAMKPDSHKRQSQNVRATKPVSFRCYVLRIDYRSLMTLHDTGIVTKSVSTLPFERIGVRNLRTIYEFVRNTLSAFRHLKTPHAIGKRLLGAHQMAEGVFLSKEKKVTVRVTKPVSSKGNVSQFENHSPRTLNDTGIVTLTQCRVVSYE
jgi:hypothetical protein